MECPDTPECDKLAAHGQVRHIIAEFLEWLYSEREMCIARHGDHIGMSEVDSQDMVLIYLGVDPEQLERERRALLAHQGSLNER
jgi:hypothetical protein